MINRQELVRSKEYWLVQIQNKLFNSMEDYMRDNNLNRSQLAKQMGVSKGYITQVLNGDYDHRLSKFVELLLQMGMVPEIAFRPIEDLSIRESEPIDTFKNRMKQV